MSQRKHPSPTRRAMSSQIKLEKGSRTKIAVLDKLLGYDPWEKPSVCLEAGTVVLIRGEPGAGKTTLGLQILSGNYEEHAANENNTRYAFFSLERDPKDVLEFAIEKYGFFAHADVDSVTRQISVLSADKMESLINEALKDIEANAKTIAAGKQLLEGIQKFDMSKLFESLAKALVWRMSQSKHRRNISELATDRTSCTIIFVDSLNVLVQLLQRANPDAKMSERLLLNSVCTTFRELFPQSVILFTSEHHYRDVTQESAVSESFFCDVEIALFSEPIVVPANYDARFESPLGSNALSLMTEEVKSIQTQSFCRVLKSRRTPNQSRRCAYDIVSGKGIELYETYPGDGHLTLFAENACQREIWRVLFERDLPLLYPALRYDSFDRSGLQRTSAAQRRFRYVPPRLDMCLASFDNYWINWYSELCLKSNIADRMARECGQENLLKSESRLRLLNDIHANLIEAGNFIQFSRDLHKELEKERIPKSKKASDTFLSDLLTLLAKADPSDERTGDSSDVNRPCLQCLWCRNVLRRLDEELTKLAKRYRQLIRRTWEAVIKAKTRGARVDSTVGPPPQTNRRQGAIEEELTGIVEDLVSSCHRSRAHDCPFSLKKTQPAGESAFRRFLTPEGDKCLWRQKVTESTNKFLDGLSEQTRQELATWIATKLEGYMFGDLLPVKLTSECARLAQRESSSNTDEQTKKKQALGIVRYARLIYDVVQGPSRYRLTSPIPGDKLRLFGERKSAIIAELESHVPDARRPIHRPVRLLSLHDQSAYCSIPYDANISFIVFRRDILDHFYVQLQDKRNEAKKVRYINIISELAQEQEKALSRVFGEGYAPNKKMRGTNTVREEVEGLVKTNLENVYPPQTWEEIIAYYLLNQEEHGPTLHFLIETQTPDTFLCMMLEFIWSCGANLRILPDYSIDQREETRHGLFRAFYLMALMFQNQIIPVNSTLDVHEFSRNYGHAGERAESRSPDWVFARHWYSTLIDILSARQTTGDRSKGSGGEFLWQQPGARIDIMPIPVSLSNYRKHQNEPWHVSCWGDWHLAMISGAENRELGIDLINNLMSSDRICERAFANAAVPTVEYFYEQYGDTRCVNLPGRKDIVVPDWTYGRLRKELFTHAKSRSQIFDYHHCMRELHSVLEYVHLAARYARPQQKRERLDRAVCEELSRKIEEALKNINGFKDKAFLLA